MLLIKLTPLSLFLFWNHADTQSRWSRVLSGVKPFKSFQSEIKSWPYCSSDVVLESNGSWEQKPQNVTGFFQIPTMLEFSSKATSNHIQLSVGIITSSLPRMSKPTLQKAGATCFTRVRLASGRCMAIWDFASELLLLLHFWQVS